MPAMQYLDKVSEGSANSSGRVLELKGEGLDSVASLFGAVSEYGTCGCCGGFHSVFDAVANDRFFLMNADDRGGLSPNGKLSLSTADAGAQLTRGNWLWAGATLGQPLTITYAFRATSMSGDPPGFSRFTDSQILATQQALASWSDVANINFQPIQGTDNYSDQATILFANYSDEQTATAAYASMPGSRDFADVAGDVWVNSSNVVNQEFSPVSFGQMALVHEIGHALGLGHPSRYGEAFLTYETSADYYEDSLQYTVMSYFDERETGANFGPLRYPSAPMMDDISAAQRLYGANMATRTGDTVYGFNSTAVRPWFSATSGDTPLIFAVWDAGGNDTLDFSGYAQMQVIDLRQGAFSNVGGLTGNVSIAVGAVIENAIGGSGADRLVGNSIDNTLTGNAGNDYIDGGLGSDTATFNRARSEYTVAVNGQIVTVTHVLDGTDTLVNVEFLRFSDQTIAAGTSGALMVSGDMLDNVMNGTGFNDSLSGLGGNDTLTGDAGNDRLDGGGGDDTIFGNDGDDEITGGSGNDTLIGGAGVDVANYAIEAGGVRVDLAAGVASSAAGNDTLMGFETIRGSMHDDDLTGDAQANTIWGQGGADILNGGAGNDMLDGGFGDDIISGGDGDDTLTGGVGDDTLIGGAGFDIASYIDAIGTVHVNLATGLASISAGNDTLSGIEGIRGGRSHDLLTGDDHANTLLGDSGDDVLHGGAGNDTLDGGSGADTVFGGDGDDVVVGSLGNDTLSGGAGEDTADYSSASDTVQVNLTTGLALGNLGRDTLTGFEHVRGGNSDDVLTGNALANTLSGGGGRDRLIGGAGNDTLSVGSPIAPQFIPDIIKGSAVANATIATAVDTAWAFHLQARGGVENGTTIPHATVRAISHDGVEYYAVTVAAGDAVQFDIDNASFDAALRLFDVNGVELARNNDAVPGTGDGGAPTDPLISYTFAAAGTYYIQVSKASGPDGGSFISGALSAGTSYQLNISIPSAPVVPVLSDGSTLNGGDGDDVLTGGSGGDILIGGAGSDTIDGGLGVDTLVLTESAQSYVYERIGSGWRITDATGYSDKVSNVEYVSFAGASAVDLESAFAKGGIDPFRYMAGYTDLLATFRTNPAGATQHYANAGRAEGRSAVSFDGLSYIASHPDLIKAFGADAIAGARHYVQSGWLEGRSTSTFRPLDYAASNPDLARTFGADVLAATAHFISFGFDEGRPTSGFDALLYLASNPSLAKAVVRSQPASEWHDVAVKHYLDVGAHSGGPVYTFDPLLYAASNLDLARAFGSDGRQALQHYLTFGADEGRPTVGFDAGLYAASHLDLARLFGADAGRALTHYLDFGVKEGRATSGFDSVAYLLTYGDLGGLGANGALDHWLMFGADEGRIGDAGFGRDQTTHRLIGTTEGTLEQATDRDWFQAGFTAGHSVTIALTGAATTVELYDGLGNRIPSAAGQPGNVFNIATTGSHYVVVSGLTGTFTLSTSAVGPAPSSALAEMTKDASPWVLPGLEGSDEVYHAVDFKVDDPFVLPRLEDLSPPVVPDLDEGIALTASPEALLPPTGNIMLTLLADGQILPGERDAWHRFHPEDGWMLQ